jgi:hypothetical protein
MVPALLLSISLALPRAGLTPLSYNIAIAEAAEIWSVHGVAVVATGPDQPPPANAVLIRIVVERRPGSRTSGHNGPLASIRFDENGPESVIALYLPDLIEMIADSNVPGSGGDPWPMILRERAIGRAVGRVLAHELGHYLLRSRTHAPSGLMRAVQFAADLVGAGRDTFALSAEDAARWAAVASTRTAPPASDCDGGAR